MKKIAEMKQRVNELVLKKWVKFKTDNNGADMIEWVGIIALVIGVIIIISPNVRSSIQGLFSSVFGNLQNMSAGD